MRIRTKIPVIDAVIVLTEKIGSWLERYRIRVYAAQASFFMTKRRGDQGRDHFRRAGELCPACRNGS